MTEEYDQTTVTLTGGPKVNLRFNPDRISHLKAREALAEIQAAKDVSQRKAVEIALCYVARTTVPGQALEILTAKWDESDAECAREALRRYGRVVQE
jgi:hypothetical protein